MLLDVAQRSRSFTTSLLLTHTRKQLPYDEIKERRNRDSEYGDQFNGQERR